DGESGARAPGPRTRVVRRRDVAVDGPLPAADRETAADARVLARLVAAELHDGAVEAARGAGALHPALPARTPLSRRPDRALVPQGPDDLLRSRVAPRGAHGFALLRPLTLGREVACV